MLKIFSNLFAKKEPQRGSENFRFNDGVLLVQQNNLLKIITILSANTNSHKILGYDNDDILGRDLRDFLTEADVAEINDLNDFDERGKDLAEILSKIRLFKIRKKNGEDASLRLRVVRAVSKQGAPTFQLVFNHDLIRDTLERNRNQFRQNLKGNEIFDDLTGLLNYHSVLKDVELLSFYAGKAENESLLVMFEVSNAAEIAAQMGEAAAQEMRKKLGLMLDSCKREEDISGRISENAFVLILPETPEVNAEIPIKRVVAKFEQLLQGHSEWQTKPELRVKFAVVGRGISAETQIANLLS